MNIRHFMAGFCSQSSASRTDLLEFYERHFIHFSTVRCGNSWKKQMKLELAVIGTALVGGIQEP